MTGRGEDITRVRLSIRGRVQGVGFRPFVYRLAHDLQLCGWVRNDNRGVTSELEGRAERIAEFERRLHRDLRLPARIDDIRSDVIAPTGDFEFSILSSSSSGSKETTLLSDLAPCAACRSEIADPANRRYRYAFTNCTHCGPRFTIIRAVPYDRPNTTMAKFRQCERCQHEYDDPFDRRFHAQPNACPTCGPKLGLVDTKGAPLVAAPLALKAAADAIRQGAIVALLGIGGFQLIVDARNDAAVLRLRERKHRSEKPLAVMVGKLGEAEALADISPDEAALLVSPEAPIVLVRRRLDAELSPHLAPGNPYLGLMLPASPLHHLLLDELGFPIVATSGNLSEEPTCIDPTEARERLGSIADGFLVHDRPVERHADDSVAMVVGGDVQLVRRARGYAPLPVALATDGPPILALGGHVKSTVALAIADRCFLSQHIGDLDNVETRTAFLRVINDFLRMYEVRPKVVAHDLHPDYASTQIAEELTAPGGLLEGTPRIAVQHHHAHLAACLADAGTDDPVLGVLWDGTGLGTDRTIWGGEFLFGNAAGYERVACIQPLFLPGGDRSARSPRRVAVAMLYQLFGPDWLERRDIRCVAAMTAVELRLLYGQIERRILSPYSSSMGRLFDAVASILDLHHDVSFEGQAAMALEFLADPNETGSYPLNLIERTLLSSDLQHSAPSQPHVSHPDATVTTSPVPASSSRSSRPSLAPRFYLDPTGMFEALVADLERGVDKSLLAARFHGALVNAAVEVARRVGVGTVALSGGCFQNRYLLQRLKTALSRQGHRVLLHHQVPTNDGGLALGQIAVAREQTR
ncbi:MAG TPA: carbamoyltransferase HypF [Polyangiaceae bacterium]